MLSTILFSLISFDKTHFYGRLDYLIRLFFFGCIFSEYISIHFVTSVYVFFFFGCLWNELWKGKSIRTNYLFIKKNRLNIFAFDVNPNGKSKIYGNGGCSCCCCCFCLTHTAGFFSVTVHFSFIFLWHHFIRDYDVTHIRQ